MLIGKIAKKEWNDNEFLLDIISDDKVKKRISSNLKWYIFNAVKAKFYFYFLSIITISAPILSGILINFTETNVIIKILSSSFVGLSSISAALLNLLDVRRKWGLYRNQAEEIKRILSEHLTNESVNNEIILKKFEESISFTDKSWKENFEKSEEKN